MSDLVKNVEKFNNQSTGEEIGNAVTHGMGTVLAAVGTVVLVMQAVRAGSTTDVVSASIYGFSLTFLYLMSTLYHSLTNKQAKKVLQVIDHCSIFILIFGSYAPICLSLLGGRVGWTLLCANGALTVIGIIANAVALKKWHKISLVLYLLMGWSVIFAIKPLLAAIPPAGFLLLLAGGLFYSIGVIFYKAERPRYMHTVWHLFVLAGSICHFFFILLYVVGQ